VTGFDEVDVVEVVGFDVVVGGFVDVEVVSVVAGFVVDDDFVEVEVGVTAVVVAANSVSALVFPRHAGCTYLFLADTGNTMGFELRSMTQPHKLSVQSS
jgi:hypothetical protein